MGDEKKINIIVVDDSLELSIERFKDFKITQHHTINDEVKCVVLAGHGSAVLSAFVQTIDHYTKSFSLYPKEKFEIFDFCIYSNDQLAQLKAEDAGPRLLYKEEVQNNYNKWKKFSSELDQAYANIIGNMNVSLGFGLVDYNIVDYIDDFKKYYDHGHFIAIAAGNEDEVTTNDTMPANDPYACIVGAVYYKNFTVPEGITTKEEMQLGISTPGSSVWFVTPGRHIVDSIELVYEVKVPPSEELSAPLRELSVVEKQQQDWDVLKEFAVASTNAIQLAARVMMQKAQSLWQADDIEDFLDPSETSSGPDSSNDESLTVENAGETLEQPTIDQFDTEKILLTGERVLKESKIILEDACGTSLATPYFLALKTFIELERPDLDRANLTRLLLEAAGVINTEELRDSWADPEVSKVLRAQQRNNALSINGIGKVFYDEFGFGQIDEERLRHLAKAWQKQTYKEIEFTLEPTEVTKEGDFYCYTYECRQDFQVFNLHIGFENSKVARKEIKEFSIISPAKTTSYVYRPCFSPAVFYQTCQSLTKEELEQRFYGEWINEYVNNPINNRATDMHFYGEGTKGTWTVRTTVPLEKQQITFRANEWLVDDVYRYDDGIFNVKNPRPIIDDDGGKNILDLSYVKTSQVKVNLGDGPDPRGILFTAPDGKEKFVPIAQGTFDVLMPQRVG